MTLDQVYDELYGEIDQIKNELKNTLAQIQYASNFTEGVPLGTLSVGAESSQVIVPHVALLPGAESGMMILDLPVGTESAMLPVQIQDDPEATELVPDAIPTGETMESYLNSNLANKLFFISLATAISIQISESGDYFAIRMYKGSGRETFKDVVILSWSKGSHKMTISNYNSSGTCVTQDQVTMTSIV